MEPRNPRNARHYYENFKCLHTAYCVVNTRENAKARVYRLQRFGVKSGLEGSSVGGCSNLDMCALIVYFFLFFKIFLYIHILIFIQYPISF